MYEAIRHCRLHVHVVCDACICSAGTIVMLGAAKRTMYNTPVILVYALLSWAMGMQKPKQLKEELQYCKTLLEIMTDVYKRHTRLTKVALKKLYDTDLYMRADECLQPALKARLQSFLTSFPHPKDSPFIIMLLRALRLDLQRQTVSTTHPARLKVLTSMIMTQSHGRL
eukprot:3543422-Pleurochrysis_carterae.AAC.1